MGCLRLLFISGLFSTMIIAKETCRLDSSEYNYPQEILREMMCRHYDIKLVKPALPKTEDLYWIDVNINIEIHDKMKIISINYDLNSKIDERATILFSPSTYPVHFPKKHVYCPPTQILLLLFDIDLMPGNYTLHMLVKNTITDDNKEGFSKITYLDNFLEKRAIFITNYLWAARKVFPCCDEPRIKATFAISVKHSRTYRVLSNTIILKQSEERNWTWTHFITTPIIPTYLVGVIMFEELKITDSLPLMTTWVRQTEQRERQFYRTNTFAVNCWNYILKTMNLTNKITSMNHVAMPPSSLPTKAYWGLYTYKEEDLKLSYKTNISLPSPQTVKIVQKLAHNMFVSIVGPAWWNNMLLNEGIATFFGLYISDKMYKNFRIMDRFVVETQQEMLSKDMLSRVQPVVSKFNDQIYPSPSNIDAQFKFNFTQTKAIILARMICYLMSDELFKKTINIYLQEHEFRSAGWQDLLSIMQNITEKSNIEHMFAWIDEFLRNWLFTSNYPVLYVELVPKNKLVKVSVKYMYKPKGDDIFWWIPITYTTESHLNFTKPPVMWYRQKVEFWTFDVPPNDWVIFNLRQTGYYRVNYDKENWRRLTEYMIFDDYTKIHPINRAQLIDDSYHLMLAGHLDSTVFLEISNYLIREKDPIVWHPIKRIVANMSIFFRFPESATIKEHIKRLANDVLVHIGLDEDNSRGDLRLILTELSCELGENICLLLANDTLVSFLQNPDIDRFSEWRNWVFCTGMKKASYSTWSKMYAEFSRTKQDPYLESLSCAEDTKILTGYIDLLLAEQVPISEIKREEVITSIIKKHISKKEILVHILKYYVWPKNV